MKIVQINSDYGIGGAGKIVQSIHEYLLDAGYDSHVFFGRDGISGQHVTKHSTKIGVAAAVAETRLLGLNGFSNSYSTAQLLRHLKSIQPDIVHLHGIHGYYVHFGKLFSYLNNADIPIVWTFHDCHAITGNCGFPGSCDAWMTGCNECSNLRGYPASLVFDRTKFMWKKKKALFVDGGCKKTIVSPSYWLDRLVARSYFHSVPHMVINNGINTDVFRHTDSDALRNELGIGSDEKVIMMAANSFDNPNKGAVFIPAILGALRSSNACCVLVGGGSERIGRIGGVVRTIGVPFIQDQFKLARLYSMADVFVTPSLEENYPTVVIEALACLTPVVGFEVGGIPEQVQTQEQGAVVARGDVESMARAIDEVIARKERGKWDVSSYSALRMASNYVELYDALL